MQVGEDIYRRVLEAPLDKVVGPVGGLTSIIKGFDQVREFFTSATLALVVDLPFVFLFVFVIYLISGPLAIIPLCAIPIVIGVGLIVQPFIARHAEKAAETGKSKYSLIIESLSGLDTIKTVDASDIFLAKYKDTVNEGAEFDTVVESFVSVGYQLCLFGTIVEPRGHCLLWHLPDRSGHCFHGSHGGCGVAVLTGSGSPGYDCQLSLAA